MSFDTRRVRRPLRSRAELIASLGRLALVAASRVGAGRDLRAELALIQAAVADLETAEKLWRNEV